jgi:hypothetical protein
MTYTLSERTMATTDDDTERSEAILEFAEFDREEHKEIYDDLANE